MSPPSTALVNDCARPLANAEEDYSNAVVHVAWAQLNDSQKPILLFAWVELLPAEVPPPPNCPTDRLAIANGPWAAVAHVVTNVPAALDWYHSVRDGKVSAPDDNGRWTVALCSSAQYVEEPSWPSMVCDSGEVPFVPCCWQYPRVHHLLPASGTPLDDQSLEEKSTARLLDFISARFHFAFKEYPEYLGSVHLVAPNPIFRGLHKKLHAMSPDRDELWIRLEPRAGKSEVRLSMLVSEGRPTGAVGHFRTIAGNERVKLLLAGRVRATTIRIFEEERGLIFDEPTSVFPQGFSTTMFMVSSSRVVDTPSGAYEVPIRSEPVVSHTSIRKAESSGVQRLYSGASARRERKAAESTDQYWLENREQGLSVVRGLIYQGNAEIMLVDAWFCRLDLDQFVLALGGSRTKARVLCGSVVRKKENNLVKPKLHQEDKKILQQELLGLKKRGFDNEIEVRIMPGRRKPRIHDRFLVCDGQVWSLGSSLNHLGERRSVVVRLPAPDPVRERLYNVWEQATDLNDWLGRKHESEPT